MRPALRLMTLILAFVLAPCSYSADLLIKNAKLLGDDGFDVPANILIRDGKIASLSANIQAPEGIAVFDAMGSPVTPAMFAGVTVTGLADVEAVKESVDSHYQALFTELMHPEFDVRFAYNPHSSVVPITRIEGFGYTLLAASSGDRSISGMGGLVRLDGGYDSFEGRDTLFVDVDGKHSDNAGGSRAGHWMLLRQAFAEADGDVEARLLNEMGIKALKLTKRKGVFVFNANRAADIMQVIRFSLSHKLDSVIHGGREAWAVADALAAANMPVILNALDNLPANFDSLGARLDNAALLHAAGVTVLFSSGETHNARKVRQLAGNAVANGMPYSAALSSATTMPAEVFGGSTRGLREGARADLTIWTGDPLEVTTLAKQVVLAGELVSMQSRQTKLRDRYLPTSSALPRAYLKP